MSASDYLQETFEAAKDDFLAELRGPKPHDFSQCMTIDAVYDETDRIQTEQGKTETLRNLRRIEPYLNCLNQYVGFMDTMVNLYPSILCLIWGPLKLLLQISSTLVKSFDKVVEILAEIGHCLPHFGKYAEIFKENSQMKGILCLFYKDILDFYCTTLNFFGKSKWKKFFESLWPKTLGKLNVIKNNIIAHKSLMNSEVTLESIVRADEDRRKSKDMYERIQDHQDWQSFEAARAGIDPYFYNGDLERLANESSLEAGKWLEEDVSFKKWSDLKNNLARIFWLQGIPGAGKTTTSSLMIRRKREQGENVLFAILSHNRQARDSALKILQSLIFQVLFANPELQPVIVEIYKFNFPQISSSTEFAATLLSDLVKNSGPIFIILDGVDEILIIERRSLLRALVRLSEECENLRLLISCREERDIASIIGKGVPSIRVDRNNIRDIELYVNHEISQWQEALSHYGFSGRECSDISALLKAVSSKAEGMFLFAKLVIRNVKTQSSPVDMVREVNNLPNGIEEAYHRIISRIRNQLPPNQQDIVRHTLEWIGCATSPLTKEEILQALAITPGEMNFAKGRKVFADILELCGPIIEIENGVLQFVHFTAKEFLFSIRSDKFLEKPRAHLSIGSVCLSYLSFDCLDEEAYSQDLTSHILAGDYILLTYASTEWLQHVRNGAPALTTDSFQNLQGLVEIFMSSRENYFYKEPANTKFAKAGFELFKDHPTTQDALVNMWSFLSSEGLLDKSDEKDWVDYDPSTISTTVMRVRKQIEAMLCPSQRHKPYCQCLRLQTMYGYGLFKCDRLFVRPRCACFLSNGDLGQHMGKVHADQSAFQIQHIRVRNQAVSSNPQELEEIAEDLVRNNETTYVQETLVHLPKKQLQNLLEVSAEDAHPTMLNLLLDHAVDAYSFDREKTREYLLFHAVKANNISTIKYLLDSGTNPGCYPRDWAGKTCGAPMHLVFGSDFEHLDIRKAFLSYRRSIDEPLSWNWLPRRYGAKEESSAVETLAHLARYFSSDDMADGLYWVTANSSCLSLAAFFLERGANVNHKHHGYTPLYIVADYCRKSAPEFARLLLQHGADPYPKSSSGYVITQLAGMARLEKRLGMKWDGFVKQVHGETFAGTEGLE